MPFILVFLIGAIALFQGYLSASIAAFFYAISLSIKSVIVFLLPLVIFSLLFKTATQFSRGATKAILFILIGIVFSNFISTMIAYQVGVLVSHFDISIALPEEGSGFMPAWTFSLPSWISNAYAMFSGLFLGVILSRMRPLWAAKGSKYLEKIVHYILKGVVSVIPIFIIGFVVKLSRDNVMISIIKDYSLIFLLVAGALFSYIAVLYLISSRFNFLKWMESVKNMLPAAVTGFSTMSSAAAMPLTIMGAEKNGDDRDFAKAIIPATVNVHLIGDCFAIPIFAFAVLKNFGMNDPSFLTYLVFAGYFVMAKFSVAAIPGGGIIVMLPILESTLGFNAEMMSLITALYILFDPVITSANVFGNGGFAQIMGKIYTRFNSQFKITNEIAH
jgi:Na+/H+-dicarboxylate symporter